MAIARIYKPSKTAMQSGKAKTGYWVLEIYNGEDKFIDQRMGWVGSLSADHEVCLKFLTLEVALLCAKNMGIDYTVEQPKTRRTIPKSYADNFRFDRRI